MVFAMYLNQVQGANDDVVPKELHPIKIETYQSQRSSDAYAPLKPVNDDLQRTLKTQVQNLREKGTLLPKYNDTLNQYNKEDSLVTMIMKLFRIKPTSSREYRAALKKTEDQLSKLSDSEQISLNK